MDVSVSVFLAKLLGLYSIIVALAMILQAKGIFAVKDDLVHHPALILFSGALAVLFGLIILLIHPVWEASWRVIITLYGVIALIKGLIRLFAPETMDQLTDLLMAPRRLVVLNVLFLLVGIYLVYCGLSVPLD